MYISNIFNNCSSLLIKEIGLIKPKIIISLSGRVFEILSENFIGKKLKIKECFGKMHILNISGQSIQYVPVVHIPKYKKTRDYYFPEQTQRLISLRNDLTL